MIERSSAAVTAYGGLFVFVAAFVLHMDNLDNALLGWDTYATIIASRIESYADFLGTFSEVMMDGRLAFGDFYRPVGNLSIAVDHAVWGLEPFGYQLTNLVLWSLSASLIFLLARRLLSGEAIFGPVVAVVFYVLHPAVLSILSIAARRTETLQFIFILLTLISLPTSEKERSLRRQLLAGLFAALAVASKETGIIVLPLGLIHQFLTIERAVLFDRATAAIRALIPAGVLIAGVLAARFAVIGGTGGYHQAAATSLIERMATFWQMYLQTVAVTGAPSHSNAAGIISVLILLALVSVLVWLFRVSQSWGQEQRRRVIGLGAVGFFWLLGQIVLACMSFQFSPRYVVGMVAGLALILAALAEGIAITRGVAHARRRSALALAAATLVLAMMPGLAGSTLWYGYPALAEASRIQKRELQVLADEIRTRPPQNPVAITVRRQVAISDKAVDHAWMLSPWGLQAWLEMSFPDTPYHVSMNNNARPSRSHWNLVLIPGELERSR